MVFFVEPEINALPTTGKMILDMLRTSFKKQERQDKNDIYKSEGETYFAYNGDSRVGNGSNNDLLDGSNRNLEPSCVF